VETTRANILFYTNLDANLFFICHGTLWFFAIIFVDQDYYCLPPRRSGVSLLLVFCIVQVVLVVLVWLPPFSSSLYKHVKCPPKHVIAAFHLVVVAGVLLYWLFLANTHRADSLVL
jgi:hypothetical protein